MSGCARIRKPKMADSSKKDKIAAAKKKVNLSIFVINENNEPMPLFICVFTRSVSMIDACNTFQTACTNVKYGTKTSRFTIADSK